MWTDEAKEGGGRGYDRALEPRSGWVELAVPDQSSGWRGIWMRVTPTTVELCAGRGGDDSYLRFDLGETVTSRDVHGGKETLLTFQWAKDVAAGDEAGASWKRFLTKLVSVPAGMVRRRVAQRLRLLEATLGSKCLSWHFHDEGPGGWMLYW